MVDVKNFGEMAWVAHIYGSELFLLPLSWAYLVWMLTQREHKDIIELLIFFSLETFLKCLLS